MSSTTIDDDNTLDFRFNFYDVSCYSLVKNVDNKGEKKKVYLIEPFKIETYIFRKYFY